MDSNSSVDGVRTVSDPRDAAQFAREDTDRVL